ncbi:MAG: chorismate-binding protein, partial [Fimbriimonadales bacterium]
MSIQFREDPPIAVSSAEYFDQCPQGEPGTVVLRYRHREYGLGWLIFEKPVKVCGAQDLDAVQGVMLDVQREVARGRYAAGFSSYESAAAWDSHITCHQPQLPFLAWYGVYESPPRFVRELEPFYGSADLLNEVSELSCAQWRDRFEAVKRYLEEGTIYQLNLSYRTQFQSRVCGYSLFRSRCGVAPPRYASYVCGEGWEVVSLSPELLFSQDGETVSSIPMKGTVAEAEGADKAQLMRSDPKSMAENLMIVDMVRHDLGAFARTGSVRAKSLFDIERHRTVYQMTSTVTAETSLCPVEVHARIIPAASITGAPKVKACEIIKELELSPRNVYCGSVGMFGPGRIARFNVAIRTAFMSSDLQGEYGVGSGIVWDSECESEAAESDLKGTAFRVASAQWALRECMSATGNGYSREAHRQRLAKSMEQLHIPGNPDEMLYAAENVRAKSGQTGRIGLSVRRDGRWFVAREESALPPGLLRARICPFPISSKDLSRLHKSNSRTHYNECLDWEHPEHETLLYNEEGFVTEFTRGNVLIRLGEELVSPDPACGCLRGSYIEAMVLCRQVHYRSIALTDVWGANEVMFVNAVTGLRPVDLERSSTTNWKQKRPSAAAHSESRIRESMTGQEGE